MNLKADPRCTRNRTAGVLPAKTCNMDLFFKKTISKRTNHEPGLRSLMRRAVKKTCLARTAKSFISSGRGRLCSI